MTFGCGICGSGLGLSVKHFYEIETDGKTRRIPLCNRCGFLLKMVKRGVLDLPNYAKSYSQTIESLRERLSWSTNQDVAADLEAFLNSLTGGYPTFWEYQQAIRKKHFPANGSHCYGGFFLVNQSTKEFGILKANGIIGEIRSFDDLLDFAVSEDGVTQTSGRAGAAAVGALIAGPAGAIVGSSMKKKAKQIVNKIDIILSYKSMDTPAETLNLLVDPIQKNSDAYIEKVNLCNQIVSVLRQILDANQKAAAEKERGAGTVSSLLIADEILKLKQLADAEIITQAEFEAQKQKLLAIQ